MSVHLESMSTELLIRLPVGTIVWNLEDASDDASLRLVFANPAACKMTGKDLDRQIGRSILELFPDIGPERVRAYAEVCRTRCSQTIGEFMYSPGFTFSVAAVPALERGVIVVLENLSVLRRAEAESRQLNRFLDSIIEHLPAMIFVKDAETLRFERFNRAGEELLGQSRDALIGRCDHDFFPADQADFFVAKDREVLRKRTLEDIAEEPIDTPRGTRWLHTRKIPILDDDGRPRYLLGISIDITEQKRAQELLQAAHRSELEHHIDERERAQQALAQTEEQLRQSQRLEAIGLLAGGVAHDFNNILSVVLGYSESALARLPAGDPLRDDFEEIRRAGERGADVTRQLLTLSRQQVLQERVLNVNDVVRGMERLLPRLLREDIDLSVVTRPDLGLVLADPGQIEQVLMNLIVNARDAMPTGGKLTIETANVQLDEAFVSGHGGGRPGSYILLAVSDTGVGMDRQTLARAFEPFFTTKGQGKGSGLGLSTAFGIVKQSGGSINAYSELGKGATFKVYLPVTTERRQDELSLATPPAELRGSETVLLVEDDDQLRRLATAILERFGYRVVACRGPAEAIDKAAGQAVDLLVTDVVMPEMSGRLLAEALDKQIPDLRVLFMSGYTDDAVVRHGVLESRMAFLQKPFTPEALARKVREVLKAPAPKGPSAE